MPYAPFARWRPDVSALNSDYAADIMNVLLSADGNIPFPKLAPFSTAVSGTITGGFSARSASGTIVIFVGTTTKLYKLNGTTLGWDPVSKLGAETILTGDFAADVNWTKGAGWTISGGKAHATAVANGVTLSQAQALTAGTVYKIVYTVSSRTAGGVRATFTGGTTVTGTTNSANGTYTDYLTAVAGNNTLAFEAVGSTTLDLDDVSIKALANYGSTTDERWRFAQFGNDVIAVNINDNPQVYTIGSSTEFADLAGSPPRARYINTWGSFVALMNLAGSLEKRVHWSGLENDTQWTPGVNSCDFQDFPDGGSVQGSSSATNPFILMKRAIYAGTFIPGSTSVFSFTKIHDKRGAAAPYSIASRGALTFFADSGGLFQLNADGSIAPIGFEKIDRTIFSQISGPNLAGILGEIDPFFNRYYMAVKISSTTTYDRLVIYDWGLGEFTQQSDSVGILFPLGSGTLGYTLEGLSAVSASIDALPFSLDSKVWQGGAPVMAAIDANNMLGFYSGANAEATITTQEFGATDGQLTRITEIVPAVDTQTLYVSIGARKLRSATDVPVYTAEAPRSTNTGVVHKRSRARFTRIKIRIPDSTVWTKAQGVNHNGVPAGLR
jgi:hypothetical protein